MTSAKARDKTFFIIFIFDYSFRCITQRLILTINFYTITLPFSNNP